MMTNLQLATIEHFGAGMGKQTEARRRAAALFDQVHGRGVRRKWWGKLMGKANGLRRLSRQPVTSRRPVGTVIVPIDQIVGTENRGEDFDADFNPLKQHNRERWIHVAAACQTGVILPAVELVKAEDGYYVRDGHHRISVARALGLFEIEAQVVN